MKQKGNMFKGDTRSSSPLSSSSSAPSTSTTLDRSALEGKLPLVKVKRTFHAGFTGYEREGMEAGDAREIPEAISHPRPPPSPPPPPASANERLKRETSAPSLQGNSELHKRK